MEHFFSYLLFNFVTLLRKINKRKKCYLSQNKVLNTDKQEITQLIDNRYTKWEDKLKSFRDKNNCNGTKKVLLLSP